MSAHVSRPFVICSDLRTGSHMLATALHGHAQLRVAGEVLVRPERFGLPRPSPGERRPTYERRLLQTVWQRFDGCIMHRRHVRGLRYIARRPEIQVLFLRRENWLLQFASERLAQRTGVWHVAEPQRDYLSDDGLSERLAAPPTVRLSPAECRRFRDETAERERRALELLHRHSLRRVSYEELTADWEATLAGVQEFLGVAQQRLEPATQRQELRRLSEVIENLAELQEFHLSHGSGIGCQGVAVH